jgi:hypothetical protein
MMDEKETTKKMKFPTLARKRMKEQDEHQTPISMLTKQ